MSFRILDERDIPRLAGMILRETTRDAYSKGDKVTYNGKRYVSEGDSNVWTPDTYGWKEV